VIYCASLRYLVVITVCHNRFYVQKTGLCVTTLFNDSFNKNCLTFGRVITDSIESESDYFSVLQHMLDYISTNIRLKT